jgi:hypothetical protein
MSAPAPGSAPILSAAAKSKGWHQMLDSRSGKYYYYNKTTKATTWVMPENEFSAAELAEEQDPLNWVRSGFSFLFFFY